MTLIFELSMPNVGSWDGRWSGADNYYAMTRLVSPKSELREGYFHYNFGDGWSAGVTVRPSSGAAETRKVRKRSKGFCGYEWMVDEILKYGKIRSLAEQGVQDAR